jgi:hypothetical protein
MPLAAGTSAEMKTASTMEYVAMRPDRLIEWCPWVAGRQCHHIVIGPGRRLKPWGRLGGHAHTLQSITMESDDEHGKDVASRGPIGDWSHAAWASLLARWA